MNKSTAVIEINGCKLSPEFIELVEQNISQIPAEGEQFKKDLFDVQTAILMSSDTEDFRPENLRQLALALHNIYSFIEGITQLRKEGKF